MKRENDVSSKTLSYFFLFNLYPSLSSIYLLKNIFFIKKMHIKKFIYKEYYKIKSQNKKITEFFFKKRIHIRFIEIIINIGKWYSYKIYLKIINKIFKICIS